MSSRLYKTLQGFTFKTLVSGLALAMMMSPVAAFQQLAIQSAQAAELFQIVPKLSSASVKNGQTLQVSALVKSTHEVAMVKASIVGMKDTIFLKRISGDGFLGSYSGTWQAKGLEEKEYTVTVTAFDKYGNMKSDSSLSFTDPILGLVMVGTSTYQNGGMQRVDALSFSTTTNGNLTAGVIDTVNGFAYFGTNPSVGSAFSGETSIIKVNLSNFTRVGEIAVNPASGNIMAAALDAAGGVAYFVGDAGDIVKVNLATFTGTSTLATGADLSQSNFNTLAIDGNNNYLYLGDSLGMVYKISLGSFTVVDTLDLASISGDVNLSAHVIDTANGFLYFGTNTGVVKIDLSSFTHVSTLDLTGSISLSQFATGAIDGSHGFAYFTTFHDPGYLVKIDLSTFAFSSALSLGLSNGNGLGGLSLDVASSTAFVGVVVGNSIDPEFSLAKIDVNGMSVMATTTVIGQGGTFIGSVIDSGNGMVYFAGGDNQIVKFPESDLSNQTILSLPQAENYVTHVIHDSANGYSYYLTSANPATVVKVRASDFTRVGSLILNSREHAIRTGFLDAANGFLYVVTSCSTPLNGCGQDLIKIDLSTFTQVNRLNFSAANPMVSSAVDGGNGYAYIVGLGTPGKVFRINLTSSTNDATLTLNSGDDLLSTAAVGIDAVNGYLYIGTNTSPGKIVKVNLSSFTRVGSLTLNSGENFPKTFIIDSANQIGYVGTHTSAGRVVKVNLNTLSRIGAVTLNSGENYLDSSFADLANDAGYFVASVSPTRIVKVKLSNLTRAAAITLASGENAAVASDIDLSTGHAYVGTFTAPIQAVRILTSPKGAIKATKAVLGSVANTVQAFKIYSYTATGTVRLALYNSSTNLVWESGAVTNTAANSYLSIPVASGTPSVLMNLATGTYYLAFQTNVATSVASLALGSTGDGWEFVQGYGSFPNTVTTTSSTNEKWTMFFTYDSFVTTTQTGGTTEVTEGGATDTYQIALTSAPTGNVQVTLSPDSQITLSTSTLIFTPGNYTVPQTVTVTAVDDASVEGDHTGSVGYSVSSTDLSYDQLAVDDFIVTVHDND